MSDDEDIGFKINTKYAENYNRWRQKEELQRLKDKYGDVQESEGSSSSSEEEDEDAEDLTPRLEKDWLKTLSALKSKDPRIYDKDAKFYHSEDSSGSGEETQKKAKKQKPMFLKDYERKVILEKEGHLSDEASDGDTEFQPRPGPSYYEEQDELRHSIRAAAGIANEDSDSDDDLLVKRAKTKEDEAKEEQEYLEWLKTQPKDDEKKAGIEELVPLKEYWSDPKLADGEKFLRDYILNKRYLDDGDEDRIPTYDEIVNDNAGFSEEEEQLEKEETFERKFNFRYEEPDEDFIKSYPRTIGDSVRRKDSKRAEKRQEINDRKMKEKEKKREEIAQLKRLKKKEIQSKLDRIKEITGTDDLKLTQHDLDEDFDPDKYDHAMKAAFDDDYYEGEGEDEKPVFTDDEELGLGDGKWGHWQGGDEDWQDPHCEDPNFNMDADYIPAESKKKKKKGKGKQKEVDNEDEEFEELYKLDYEDMIGDLPCRFKYREVVPNDFGLDTEEVLFCSDKELNAWASLKKSLQYRTEEEEHWDCRAFKKRARNEKKKLNVLTSLQQHPEESDDEDEGGPTKKKKKRRKKKNTAASATITRPEQADVDTSSAPVTQDISKKRKISLTEDDQQNAEDHKQSVPAKKKKSSDNQVADSKVSKNNLNEADGFHKANPQKDNMKKKTKKKKKKQQGGKKPAMMSEERMKAYGFDPNRFKHTVMKKLHSEENR